MEASTNNIHFIYLGRLKDGAILLQSLTNPRYQDRLQDFQAYALTLIKKQAISATATDNVRLKSETGGLSWHTFCDQNSIMIGAVTHPDYPDDICTQMLRQINRELYDRCQELKKDPQSQETAKELGSSGSYRLIIHEIHGRYRDQMNLDKSVKAMSTIDRVTGVMKENLGKIIDNRQQMFDIESRSGDLRDTAMRFKTQS